MESEPMFSESSVQYTLKSCQSSIDQETNSEKTKKLQLQQWWAVNHWRPFSIRQLNAPAVEAQSYAEGEVDESNLP